MRYIKLYEQFIDQLNELNAKPYFWKWDTNKTATFDSPDDSYTVWFKPTEYPNTYSVSFESENLGMDQTIKGPASNAMRVLSTVLDVVIAFLDNNKEYDVEFVGAKDSKENYIIGPSKRDRIYKMMMQDLPDEYKWELASDKKTINISRTLVPDKNFLKEIN